MPKLRRLLPDELEYLEQRLDAAARREAILTPDDLELLRMLVSEVASRRQDEAVEREPERDDDG